MKRKDKDLAHIDENRYRELRYFCFQYNSWKQEIKEINMDLKPGGMNYDGMPKSSSVSSETERKALRLALLQRKVDIIDEVANDISSVLGRYIIFYCTNRNTSFAYLKTKMNIPCSEPTFFRHRALFFRSLSSALDEFSL